MKNNDRDLEVTIRLGAREAELLEKLLCKKEQNQEVLTALQGMEQRLTDAIEKHAKIAPSIVKAALKLQSALDALDATIPDKQK